MSALLREGLSSAFVSDHVLRWLIQLGRIALIVIVAHGSIRLLGRAVERIFASTPESRLMSRSRACTVAGLIKSITRYAINLIAGLAILERLGIPAAPLLAGAGVASLALGFGAQGLVRDFIAGFFILFENQFSVGDHIQAAGVTGRVDEMGLRVTKIRDFGGQLHIVPNGNLELITNFSVGPMRVLFPVTVSYEEDFDRVVRVVESALAQAAAELPDFTTDPYVLGLDEVTKEGMSILIMADAKPGRQYAMGRELRRRVKAAMDLAGIQAPYPRQLLVAAPTREEHADHGP